MPEPEAGTKHSRKKWGRLLSKALIALAAVATILGLVLGLPDRFEILGEEEYKRLLDLDERHKRSELIAKADCPKPNCPPAPSAPPEVDQVTILTTAIDELIKDAGFLTRYIGKADFFDRFDKWRTKAKNKLADGQKLIHDAKWTSNEDWVGTFHAQTHIKTRDLVQEPYRPEEYRGFLEAGSRVLERMKREVILHSGRGNPPAGGSSSAPLTPDS